MSAKPSVHYAVEEIQGGPLELDSTLEVTSRIVIGLVTIQKHRISRSFFQRHCIDCMETVGSIV
jgi:hypothetical protein